MDSELLSPHELVDELGDELFGVLVRSVHVVASRDDDGKVERPNDQRKQNAVNVFSVFAVEKNNFLSCLSVVTRQQKTAP